MICYHRGRVKTKVKGARNMNNTPVDKRLREGLKVQAKLAALSIQDILHSKFGRGLSQEELESIMDSVYTVLFTSHFCSESEEARQFMKSYAQAVSKCQYEPSVLWEGKPGKPERTDTTHAEVSRYENL